MEITESILKSTLKSNEKYALKFTRDVGHDDHLQRKPRGLRGRRRMS